jgi:hypothetical protein
MEIDSFQVFGRDVGGLNAVPAIAAVHTDRLASGKLHRGMKDVFEDYC